MFFSRLLVTLVLAASSGWALTLKAGDATQAKLASNPPDQAPYFPHKVSVDSSLPQVDGLSSALLQVNGFMRLHNLFFEVFNFPEWRISFLILASVLITYGFSLLVRSWRPKDGGFWLLDSIPMLTPVVVMWTLTACLAVSAVRGWIVPQVLLGVPVAIEIIHRAIHAVRRYRGKLVGIDLFWNSLPESCAIRAPELTSQVLLVVGTADLKFESEEEARSFCETWRGAVKHNCQPGGEMTWYVRGDEVEQSKDVEQSIRDTLVEEKPLPWTEIAMSPKAHFLRLLQNGTEVSVQCIVRHDVVDGFATLCLFAECMGMPRPTFELPRTFGLVIKMLEVNPLMLYFAPAFMAQFLSMKPPKTLTNPPHLTGFVNKEDLRPLSIRFGCSTAMLLQASMVCTMSAILDRDICVGLVCRVVGQVEGAHNSISGVSVWIGKGSSIEDIVSVLTAFRSDQRAILQIASGSYIQNRFPVAHAFGVRPANQNELVDLLVSNSVLCREDTAVARAYHRFVQDALLKRPARVIIQGCGERFIVDCAYDPEKVPEADLRASLSSCLPQFQES